MKRDGFVFRVDEEGMGGSCLFDLILDGVEGWVHCV